MSRDAQSSKDWQGRKTENEGFLQGEKGFEGLSLGEKGFEGLSLREKGLQQRDFDQFWPRPASERSGSNPCQDAWHRPYL